MNQFIRAVATLLVTAFLAQDAGAQFNVSGPGFVPDENGTNLDEPKAKKVTPKVAAGNVIKDCAECPEMVVIPTGGFVMGSEKNVNEQPPHSVAIRSFLMGKTEVTQKQWLDVMGSNPSRFEDCGLECPVENVNWNEVQAFIRKLNQQTGQSYRLPSEAEWEYAARAGITTDWSFGWFGNLGNYAWFDNNSRSKAHVVGQRLANAFGLFDMHGNVWEWTQDCWHKNYLGAPSDGSAWTTACAESSRVLRGGSWGGGPLSLRSAFRVRDFQDKRFGDSGFRLARDL